MKRTLLIFASFLTLYYFAVNCSTEEAIPIQSDPIVTFGHGSFVGEDGKNLKITASLIRSIQRLYLEKLRLAIESGKTRRRIARSEIEKAEKFIHAEVGDKLLANAVLLDWLMDKAGTSAELNHLSMVNNALRWEYVLKIQKKGFVPKNNKWTLGIDPKKVALLEGYLKIPISAVTSSSMSDYCKECLEAEVPVPDKMFGSRWKNLGIIQDVFISEGRQAELYIYESENPKGVCLALPRFDPGGNEAKLFGVICLGTQSSKACFFDNPQGKFFTKDVEIDFRKNFIGGADLAANGQGACTDCHAGENPYIVHPDKPPFSRILSKIRPAAWHYPLVISSWPHNPGPSNQLSAINSNARCDGCHQAFSAGRFPVISNQLNGYCSVVLKNALGMNPSQAYKRTMPQGGGSTAPYSDHINALISACGAAPPEPGVVVNVNYPNDPGFLSPPLVIGPLYQCATSVAVRGVVLNSKVTLYVNGNPVGSVSPARNPDFTEFKGLPALVAGQKITARQESGGISAESSPVIVRDHKADFPNGLPAPAIDPTLIYECAEVIAIRHVPGATVTVYSNGGNPIVGTGSTDWTTFWPQKRPFVIGDKFTAEIKLCNDKSPMSSAATAIAAPNSLRTATFNPISVFTGQELVSIRNLTNGSRTTVEVQPNTIAGSFSTPISWYTNFDVATPIGRKLSATDQLGAIQTLCGMKSGNDSRRGRSCEDLPAPRIEHPVVGATYVIVSSAVPGARIRVYDDAGKEIGDGSGTVIWLSRAITGTDTITVVQQLGDCTSKQGFLVSVRN